MGRTNLPKSFIFIFQNVWMLPLQLSGEIFRASCMKSGDTSYASPSPLLPAKVQNRRRLREVALWLRTHDCKGWPCDPAQVCVSPTSAPVLGGECACPAYLPYQINRVDLDKNCDCLWIPRWPAQWLTFKKKKAPPYVVMEEGKGRGGKGSLNRYAHIISIRGLT